MAETAIPAVTDPTAGTNPTPAVAAENRFEDLADRIMAREAPAAAKVADAAPVVAPEKALTPAVPSVGEKSGAASAAVRDEAGRFANADEQLVRIVGPWGEEVLDPRKPDDRARLVEYGQKGRNYQELLAKDDQRVKRSAQEMLFDNYRAMGLIGVNPDGTTFWTPKGLRVMNDQEPATGSPAAAQKPVTAADTAGEVDSLVAQMFETDDPAVAKNAFLKAVDALAEKRGQAIAEKAVEKLWQEKARELDAKEATRRQGEANVSLIAKLNTKLGEELKKHSLASDPYLTASATELVRIRMAAFEKNGVPSETAFEQALPEVAHYARSIRGAQGVKDTAGAAQVQRSAPPATGGGSAPPPAAGKHKFSKRDPFGDEFQERVLNRVRAR